MALSASDLNAIYSLLTNSMSGDESVRKPAEAALSQFESRQGFCSCLMEVITAKDLAPQVAVRLMASVYFKNTINRYWRIRRDSVGISNEEKLHLRQKLLSHLREENYQIAVILAVLISKIARVDYPKEWPELFSVLAQQLQSTDVLTSHRIFLIIFRTLKELSIKRLPADQRNFAEISSHLFDYSWRLWQNDIQTILHGFSMLAQSHKSNALEQHQELYLTCERWLLCSKIIRQLVTSGFPSDAKCVQEVQPVKQVCPVLLNAIKSLLPYYSSFQKGHPKFWDFVERACIKLMKVLVAIHVRHPYSFGDKCVLAPVMDFCLITITDPEPVILSYDQFLIQCMVMVKHILECKEYKPSVTGRVMDETGITVEQTKRAISKNVGGILASVLPPERVVHLCNVLIRRYFVLTARDLEVWYRNPESFHHEQDMVQWTEKLRPCAEALYIVLLENNVQLLGPIVVSILQEAMNGCPTSVTEITPGLLLKDAAYGAAGYVYYELSNYLSFKDWFNGALSFELSNDHPNLRFIHRKVAMILGQWVSEVKDDTNRQVYCALIRLLQNKDLSVRLAACRSLCSHIEDAKFSEQDSSDLLPTTWDSCFKLVEEVEEFDSKVQVLNLISVLIERVSEVIPFANKLVQFFQKVWEESSGESLLQMQLLIALQNFVVALGYQSPSCYNMLLPIIQKGIDINSPDELNLLEDSMLLWEATLSHAPEMVPQLLAYFPCLVEIMERSFDHLQCFPIEVPPLINSTLQKLVVICLSGGDDRDPSKAAIKASSAAILARILVMNTNYLAQVASDPSLSVLVQQAGVPIEENILLCLVDVWIDKVDNVSSTQRKIFGLALSIILTLRLPQVLDKLDQILSVCTGVISGVNDDLAEEESSGDNMSSSSFHGESTIPSKEFRCRQIKFSDPINQLSLENSVRDNLQTCAALHGEFFSSAIGKMHPALFAQVKQALKMP
ncbi:importin-11-like isoform X3 [Tripterygium wilfordii]|uniref:importin-11-like isoform X3 n=1 Tax=Tripterygium wilfordii TaxID=458696 RepID=UPI0018F844E4|nr:importin-11-like isoform X3 [Tripterygium wilfordii]